VPANLPKYHIFYLHGLASSPGSSKAQFLAEKLAVDGLELQCPDLNEPDFSTLTTTRMISRVAAQLQDLDGEVVLIGSSLGAFVALHLAERLAAEGAPPQVARMVLMAPAFDFGAAGMGTLGADGLARWKADGWIDVPHYAYGETRRVHYELYADGGRYDSFATRATVPTLIFQGRHDDVVDPVMVERFAAARSHVRLVMVDDDHQLKSSLELMWAEITTFLGLGNGP
jgi:pimeloyl-ACP methyl ester carboxylesterase